MVEEEENGIRILMIGDFIGNTGPANVNKQFIGLKDIDYTKKQNKLERIVEMIVKIAKTDIVIFSGLSKLNIYGIKICKIFNKKSGYLMHGSVRIENEINGVENIRSINIENTILKNIDKIICVSEFFKNKVVETYGYKEKVFFVNNPVNTEINIDENIVREENLIICVGGGTPGKNIKKVCDAILKINRDYDKNYKLLVIGDKGKDIEKIKKYNFVEIVKEVNSKEMYKLYQRAQIYINNSKFETFGLAPIEASLNGCNILMSKNIGAKDIFIKCNKDKIIEDVDNHDEIARKILNYTGKILINKKAIDKKEIIKKIREIMI